MALGAGVTVVMLRAALPLLVKVTFWAALATPTLVEKVRLEALRPTSGPVPVPLAHGLRAVGDIVVVVGKG